MKGTGESRWERFGPKVVEICLMARAAGHAPVPVPVAPRKRKAREPLACRLRAGSAAPARARRPPMSRPTTSARRKMMTTVVAPKTRRSPDSVMLPVEVGLAQRLA